MTNVFVVEFRTKLFLGKPPCAGLRYLTAFQFFDGHNSNHENSSLSRVTDSDGALCHPSFAATSLQLKP